MFVAVRDMEELGGTRASPPPNKQQWPVRLLFNRTRLIRGEPPADGLKGQRRRRSAGQAEERIEINQGVCVVY